MKVNYRHPIPEQRLADMLLEATKAVRHLQTVCSRLARAKRITRREGEIDYLGRASRALTLTKLMLRQKTEVLEALEIDAADYADHQEHEAYTAHLHEQWREATDADTSAAEGLLRELG